MSDYTLKCFVESGNAYKAALMLELCGADWNAEWVDFFKGETRSEAYRDLNLMGEVPLLIDHTQGDKAIAQSGVILMHIADRFGKFVPDNRSDELEMLRWMFFDNHKLTNNTAMYRFLSRFLKKEGEPETEFMKGRMLGTLKIFNAHMQANDWIVANQPTLADISACGYLFWPDQIGLDWADYPGIQSWLERIKTLDNWKSPEDILPSGPTA